MDQPKTVIKLMLIKKQKP